jgi:hypothetical protein
MLQALANWLHGTTLSWAVNSGVPWIWPACEALHFIGLTLLIGCVGVLDLRMLGVAKGLEVGPLQRLVPWGIVGFAINLITGALFFIGNPFQYVRNSAFAYKLIFIALAGANALFFYVTGLHKRVESIGADQDAPMAARVVAATSLFLWIGVMFWGRMLPFIGNAF